MKTLNDIASMIRASLILSLQNNLHFAELSFVSIERQSTRDFELIVIADNASSDVIRTVQTRLPLLNIPARIVWSTEGHSSISHEELVISTALRSAQSDYLIFSDSNTILHQHFVEEHCNNARARQILSGRRAELSGRLSAELTTESVRDGWLEHSYRYVILDGIFGQSTEVTRGLYFRSSLLRKIFSTEVADIFPGNFSLCVEDARSLLEYLDSSRELSVRALTSQLGLRILRLRNTVVQYHCNETNDVPLRLVPGVLERVKQLRYSVKEFGFQPAMLELRRVSHRR